MKFYTSTASDASDKYQVCIRTQNPFPYFTILVQRGWVFPDLEKSQTNANNVTMLLLRQAIWGHIWKRTVEKSQTNATNVTMPLPLQAILGDIWKHTLEKSQTYATNVTMHPIRQAIWGDIWKRTVEKV